MRLGYSTYDILKALDMERELLRSWMKEGFIVPTQPAQGRGTRALFTRWDVYGVALFKELLSVGFTRKAAAAFVDQYIKKAQSAHAEGGVVEYVLFFISDGFTGIIFQIIKRPTGMAENLHWVLDLATCRIGTADECLKTLEIDPNTFGVKDVDHIHIVNFRNIQKKVDTGLSDL